MKKILIPLLAFGGALALQPALAEDGDALYKTKGCTVCHAVDSKLVGPSYKDVAAKYAGQKDAVDKLAVKIMKGGSGVWGPVPMPAQAALSDADAKTLAGWVLAGAK